MQETLRSLSSLLDVLSWRDGGQRKARRNAWAAMVADTRRARDRNAADAAVTVASAGDATAVAR